MIPAPGRQERINWTACEAPGRHQGGRKEPFGLASRKAGKDQLDSLRGTSFGRHQQSRKEPFGQLGRHQGWQERAHWTARRHQEGQLGRRGTRDGTRETCSIGLPIEFRFWKGAGFCLTFNAFSMANGPVRGTSWGGLHGRRPAQTGKGYLDSQRRTRKAGKDPLDSLRGEAPGRQERTKNQLVSLRGSREAPGRQERTIWTACKSPLAAVKGLERNSLKSWF